MVEYSQEFTSKFLHDPTISLNYPNLIFSCLKKICSEKNKISRGFISLSSHQYYYYFFLKKILFYVDSEFKLSLLTNISHHGIHEDNISDFNILYGYWTPIELKKYKRLLMCCHGCLPRNNTENTSYPSPLLGQNIFFECS